MMISGLVKASCVDYPGKLAAVIFTQGCNMRCTFCHNQGLLNSTGSWMTQYDPENILNWLKTRQCLLDGVVITGGEPTLQPGLLSFARRVKALGFALKLDTNGTKPQVVAALLTEGLLDFIAMDLKAPLSRYEAICGVQSLVLSDITYCAQLIKESGIDYQFRTTLAPELSMDDIEGIRSDFKVNEGHLLQQYRPPEASLSQGYLAGETREQSLAAVV